MTDVEKLNILGGKVGSKLVGTEHYGSYVSTDVIQITAIGEKFILAKRIISNNKKINDNECNWTLGLRNWKILNE